MTAWLVDCDGVLWAGAQPLPGAREGLQLLSSRGIDVGFFTNNSYSAHGDIVERIGRLGVDVAETAVLTSPQALASLVEAGERALVLGGRGVVEALSRRTVEVVEVTAAHVDVVVVALDTELSYERLSAAVTAVGGGARLLALNDDAVFPGEGGAPLPGTGPIAAAVEYATGVSPLYCGKPHPPSVTLVRERLGHVDVVIGDQPSSDGLLAERLGARFGLVRSGLPTRKEAAGVPVGAEGDSLLSLVSALA